MVNRASKIETEESAYEGIYLLGSIASWIVAVLTLAEMIVFSLHPQPGTIRDWFLLFQNNKMMGLLDFWGLEVLMYLMFVPVFLALYFVLRTINPGFMTMAIALAFLGIAVFFSTNNPFSMLSLSNQYAAATTGPQRSVIEAAGQTLLVNTNQRVVGSFNLGLFLVSVAGLIISVVMLRSDVFSKSTAYVGILAFALSLADYPRQAVTSSALVALLVIVPNVLFLIIWFVMVGRRLYQIGHSGTKTLPQPA